MRIISTRLMPRVCGIHRQKPKALGLKFGSPASGVLRGAVARLFLCSNGLLRACPDRNRTNLIGIALYGVAAMAGPQTPGELADRMRDHRAQHRARDGFVRETFNQPRDDARQTVREFLDRYPKPAYMSEVEHWRELSGGEIEFTMRRLRTAV